jgi:hypothetical protein
MSGISFPDLSLLNLYTYQRDTFAMDRESHAQWSARVDVGK